MIPNRAPHKMIVRSEYQMITIVVRLTPWGRDYLWQKRKFSEFCRKKGDESEHNIGGSVTLKSRR